VATSTLRPLGIGEILDAGIKVVARHWRPMVKSIVLLVFPLSVLSALATASLDPDQLELLPENAIELGSDDPAELGVRAVDGVIMMLTFLVVNIACFKIVADAWLGSSPDVGRSLRFGLRRAPMALLLTIVWAVGVVAGILALIVPGIWLAVAWALAVPALLFERVGPFKALSRSFGLVQGRWWATLLLVIVCTLLLGLVGAIVQAIPSVVAELTAPENALANGIATAIGLTLSGVIIYPYYAAVLTILYFDQRVRKEGFDLQLLAEGLGEPRDPDAPLPAPYGAGTSAPPTWDPPPPPPSWSPPPERPWSSSGGWSAPAPDAPPPPRDATPARPDASPWPDSASPRDATSPQDDGGDEAVSLEKPRRNDWLPPEAPRGPGGS
jgi:hypothetical protein